MSFNEDLLQIRKYQQKAPEMLADIFRVSLPAMRVRLGLTPFLSTENIKEEGMIKR